MWPVLIILTVVDGRNIDTCPEICLCESFITNCNYKGLTTLPKNIADDVISLDLAYNNFQTIPTEIGKLSDLKYLNVSHNVISTVRNQDFKKLKDLSRLDLSFNDFNGWKDIHPLSFASNVNLEYLDLSNNPLKSLSRSSSHLHINSLIVLRLANCSIRALPANVLDSLSNLKELHLADNFLTFMNESLRLPNLLYADLSRNHLRHITEDVFARSTALQTLDLNSNIFLKSVAIKSESLLYIDLSNCTLEKIPFGKSGSLTFLILANNFLKSIYNEEFSNFTSLQTLDLSVNSISSIEERAFYGLNNLKSLDLSYNKITDFHEKLFEMTPYLIKLNISHNYLRSLDNILSVSLKYLDASYCEIYSMDRLTLFNTPNLISMNLSRNFLTFLPDGLYSKSLIFLDVSWCRIRSLNNRTFEEMEYLRVINLAGNLLTTIDPAFFPRVVSLNVAQNQWRCDCPKLKKMYEWIASSSNHADQSLICDSPESVEGKTWRDACSHEWYPDMTQRDSLWWYSVGVVVCMVALLFGVIIVRKIHQLKEKRLQQIEDSRRAEEREALRRMQRLQREFLEETNRNAPDPRETQRPPSYNEALMLPRMDASNQSLQSIGSRGSGSEKGARRKRKRRKKPDSRRASRVVVDDTTDDEEGPRPALESDF